MKKFKISDLRKIILVLFTLSIINAGCTVETSSQYNYRIPEKINDSFEVGSLEEVNVDPRYIVDAVNEIHKGKYKEVHSMLIYKDGKLVFEEYFPGHVYQWDAPYHHGKLVQWDNTMLHGAKSVTKSITSTCIGIAVDQGFIESVHQSIFEYLPEHQHLKNDGKDKITIEHLLTMTSGLKWDEWGAPLSSSSNDIVGLWFQDKDPVTSILERPLVNEPGTSFTYSGGNMIVLGEILKNATNTPIDTFSRKYLFEPLDIDSSNWALRFEGGVIEAAGGLELTPRDMAKIGVTFLNKGKWDGKRIVSEQWVEKSAAPYKRNLGINIPGVGSGKNGYSYSWWIKTYLIAGKKIDLYNAGGWGGQEIIVIPELNTVVVFTGGNYQSRVKVFNILEKNIIPAIL